VRILLLDDKRTEREAMMRALLQGKHRVEAVADVQGAMAAMTREAAQVIVFSVPHKGGAELVRRLSAADTSGQAYLVAIFEPSPSNAEIQHIVASGAHDFLRRPVQDAELIERINAPTRHLRWAHAIAKPAAFDFFAEVDVSRLQAWKNLGLLVADDLTQLAARAFTVSGGWPERLPGEGRGATIPMSLAGDQVEVRVSIAVDSTALHWLKTALLGDPAASNEAADDALRELANTAGGAFKRAALLENITFTTGLPRTEPNACVLGEHARWTLTIDGGDGCITLGAEIRKLANQRVSASNLSEGMVLVHDVRNDGGILLVPAGSRLTGTAAAQLGRLLGSRFFLEVAPAP
jgi:DNA-binding response OmpR family regulator